MTFQASASSLKPALDTPEEYVAGLLDALLKGKPAEGAKAPVVPDRSEADQQRVSIAAERNELKVLLPDALPLGDICHGMSRASFGGWARYGLPPVVCFQS